MGQRVRRRHEVAPQAACGAGTPRPQPSRPRGPPPQRPTSVRQHRRGSYPHEPSPTDHQRADPRRHPQRASWARRHAVDVLQRWRFPDEGIEVARLLVSELATNAIQHARPAKTSGAASHSVGIGTIVLMLWPTDGGIVLAVSDPDPRPPTPRAHDTSATGGRGLALVQTMASRWGCSPTQPHPGKIVWAEVPACPDGALGEPCFGGRQAAPMLIGRALTNLREL
ncbi:ATP-binding protein [Streptomyces clavuligerus]|uniref:ATP-binding protein n=1 Tax=Streptomyces clavuligerus TaxID=1901 RepID=UPI001E41E3AF|nr:ATP-binding protein [Streptomyces clavuligerus]